MVSHNNLISTLIKHKQLFTRVVPFDAGVDKLLLMDFTVNNTTLTNEIITDTSKFSNYVSNLLKSNNCKYGIGGYNEHRTVYARSGVFDNDKYNTGVNKTSEPRRVHLGIDIWGEIDTPVFVPLGGVVHSFAFNNNYGDYGATIILQHQLDTTVFHTLYGHLSLKDLYPLKEGKFVSQGEIIGHFGSLQENGHWPPHLHFQIVKDMRVMKGDYPGVCKLSERDAYLHNCPDPDLILQMMCYAQPGL
ncbi:MAG TPA: peptidoglycan DD-metalloendopeptidase family protein [Chitinophagaceae bacterium]|nr:peptidoglycan DD-metalloendopeptidase family protein [Chitinophagaceae bacterium]